MFTKFFPTARKRGSHRGRQQRRQWRPIFESLEPRVFMSATPLQAAAQDAMVLAAPTSASAVASIMCSAPSASVGLYDPTTATFYLRSSNSRNTLSSRFAYGPADAIPITGDWSGNGIDTVGWYDPSTSVFSLARSNAAGTTTITTFVFGPADSGMLPVVGDWNGDGTDTVGLYDPTASVFYLRNSNASGYADTTFAYGPAGADWIPIVGDWNGNGEDTVGLYNPATSTFYLRNSNASGYADTTFVYGPAGADWLPIVGDWTGAGTDTIGLYNPSTSTFFLKSSNTAGFADTTFNYGSGNHSPALVPLAGIWTDSAAPSFTAAAVSDTQINLLWSTVSGASGYLVDQWIDGAWSQIGSLGGDATGYSVAGLSPGTTYYFDVAAYNSAGTSWANYQSATTSALVAVDHPAAATAYTPVSGSLFGANGPSFLDVQQGAVGDCWLMASLAEVAARDPADIRNMFTAAGTTVENGSVVSLYKVRLFNDAGVAEYFTVDTELPSGGDYYDQPVNGILWVALAEKGYAEANGADWVTTGSEGSDSYAALNGGWPSWALQAITGKSAGEYAINPTNITAAWNAGDFIVLCSDNTPTSVNIVGDHAYAVVNCTASSGMPFEVYNPWGINAAAWAGVYGLFSANATFLSQNYALQSVGTGAAAGIDDLSNANTHNLAAINAIMAEWTCTDVGDSLDPTGYKIRRDHFLGVPVGELTGTSRLNSTMASKDAEITDYLYGDRNDHHKQPTGLCFDELDSFLESTDAVC